MAPEQVMEKRGISDNSLWDLGIKSIGELPDYDVLGIIIDPAVLIEHEFHNLLAGDLVGIRCENKRCLRAALEAFRIGITRTVPLLLGNEDRSFRVLGIETIDSFSRFDAIGIIDDPAGLTALGVSDIYRNDSVGIKCLDPRCSRFQLEVFRTGQVHLIGTARERL